MALLASLWKKRPQPDDRWPVTLDDARVAVTIAEAATSLAEQGQIELLDELTPEEEAEDLRIAEQALKRYRSGEMETIPWEVIQAEWAEQEASGQQSTRLAPQCVSRPPNSVRGTPRSPEIALRRNGQSYRDRL